MALFEIHQRFQGHFLKELSNYFNDKPNIDGFTITDFHELLKVTMSELLVLFDGNYYKQIGGVTMGSPLGLTFANIFLSYHEQIWLKNCPCEFNPVILLV